MENIVELKMAVGKEEAEKLADLAGGEEHIAEYLTRLIRKLHTEQQALVGDLHLEQLVDEADLLIKKHQEYQKTISNLKGRIKKLAMSHAELMATVQTLDRDTPPALRKSGRHQPM